MLVYSALCAAGFLLAAGYRLLWRRRYPACSSGLARLRGRVSWIARSARGDSLCRLRTSPDSSTEVLLDGEVTGSCPIRAGDWITVDCLTVQRLGPSLYRAPGLADGLRGLAVMPGVWPEERWLAVPATMLGVLAGLLFWLGVPEKPAVHTGYISFCMCAYAPQADDPFSSDGTRCQRMQRSWAFGRGESAIDHPLLGRGEILHRLQGSAMACFESGVHHVRVPAD